MKTLLFDICKNTINQDVNDEEINRIISICTEYLNSSNDINKKEIIDDYPKMFHGKELCKALILEKYEFLKKYFEKHTIKKIRIHLDNNKKEVTMFEVEKNKNLFCPFAKKIHLKGGKYFLWFQNKETLIEKCYVRECLTHSNVIFDKSSTEIDENINSLNNPVTTRNEKKRKLDACYDENPYKKRKLNVAGFNDEDFHFIYEKDEVWLNENGILEKNKILTEIHLIEEEFKMINETQIEIDESSESSLVF